MRPKELARKHLGKTRLWEYLCRARFHARRMKTALIPYVPKRLLYRLLQTSDFYGEDYFDKPKNPLEFSGYGDTYSDIEEFRQVAALSQELFEPGTALDVGCAKGFLVGALRSRGIEAWGIDISEYAVRVAPAEVAPWLEVGNCTAMYHPRAPFDLVLVLETLEHVPPTEIERAVRELRRVTGRWLWASTPSIGENRFGPDGIADGKVKDACIDIYRENIVDMAPFRHLLLDLNGIPIHGHVITASFAWWTAVFNGMGFIRRGDVEREINSRLGPAREGTWNCTVFEKAESPTGAVPSASRLHVPFEEVAEGLWETQPVHLADGVHRVEVSMAVAEAGRGNEPMARALHCEGVSCGGESINASLLLSVREMRRASRGRRAELGLTCAVRGDGGVRFRLAGSPGWEFMPSPIRTIRLHGWASGSNTELSGVCSRIGL